MTRAIASVSSAMLFALAVLLQAQTPAPQAPRIRVISCTVVTGADQGVAKLAEADREAALGVRFFNDGSEPYKQITWRGKYGAGWITFVDNGEFSPGVQIDRYLLLHRAHHGRGARIFYQDYVSANAPESCAIESAVTESGATWTNPDLPATPYSRPTIPPVDGPTVPASIDNSDHNPVGLYSCSYVASDNFATGDIRFKNLGSVAMDKIVVRAFYGNSFWDFAVFGTFSPGIFIEHSAMAKFKGGTMPYYVLTLQEPKNCAVVSAHFTDGTSWTSSTMKESDVPANWPTPVPNALAGGLGSRYTNTANSIDPSAVKP